jgi:hypothetical protein
MLHSSRDATASFPTQFTQALLQRTHGDRHKLAILTFSISFFSILHQPRQSCPSGATMAAQAAQYCRPVRGQAGCRGHVRAGMFKPPCSSAGPFLSRGASRHVCVTVDEPRHNGAPCDIDDARGGSDVGLHRRSRTDGQGAAAGNGNGFADGVMRIERHHLRVADAMSAMGWRAVAGSLAVIDGS